VSVTDLDFAEPFFPVSYVLGEKAFPIGRRSIVFNLAQRPVKIRHQGLGFFRSTVVTNLAIEDIDRALVIEDFERNSDHEELFARIKGAWTLVYDATKLDRHRGVLLWRSPKTRLGNVEVNMCFAEGIPLNVGLHRTHWGDKPFREVHTQILGFGKMQHYREQDLGTLYREDPMSPGCTHEPMYDVDCVYPWHQYETTTKAIFMATEMQQTDELGV
jgi:hypothetical protein